MEDPKDHIEEYIKTWQEDSTTRFNPDVEAALQKVNRRIDEQKKKKQLKRLYLLGACSAAAAVIVFISIFAIRFPDPVKVSIEDTLAQLSTGAAQTLEYTLADGSRIWLNQSSQLSYPETFDGDTREVYLVGEAFFDIAPDAEKPFIIHANGTQTRVVGTSFGIRAINDNKEVVVTVASGIVNLSAEGKADYIKLTQGEQGICAPKEQKLEKNANPDPNLLAWKTKVLVFKQSPLSEVAKVIENTYHTPISVDSSIAGLELTSTFEQRSLEDIIQIIEMSLQVQGEKTDNGISLGGSGTSPSSERHTE